MAKHQQQTLKSTIHCSGTGVHSNAKVSMTLRPAPPGTGIMFRRIDVPGADDISACHAQVIDTTLCTTIGNDSVTVCTVEHLMAAFSGCAIDNALVEIDGGEVPVMDGSAAPFVFLIECAGIAEQSAPRTAIEVLKTIRVSDEKRAITLRPADRFSLRCDIEFDHALVGAQSVRYDALDGSFKKDLARARTFCLEADVERMRALGLGLGGSLDNAIVVGRNGVLNEGGLRYGDEFARHKALDCIGDLYLAGAPIVGHVHSVRAGHKMNHALLTALLQDESAWRRTTLDVASERYHEPLRAPIAATA